MRRVEVLPYSEEWMLKYEEEVEKLREIFGAELIEIHHIGSTSVQGMKAKPIIDMMPVVWDITKVDTFTAAMDSIGYESRGENGIEGRRYFQKGGYNRTHHVHIYGQGSPEIERHLAFRDYLRNHTDVASKYGDVKEQLAKQFPKDIESYIKGKERLASEIDEEAQAWYLSSRARHGL